MAPMAPWVHYWNMYAWFPHGLEYLEKWGKLFPVREKSEDFEQNGKVREFYLKYWKTEGMFTQNTG